MIRLVRLELGKALYNKWFVIALTVASLLAVASAIEAISTVMVGSSLNPLSKEWNGLSAMGAYGQWVFVSANMSCEIFFQVLPLFALVPYAMSLRTETIDGVLNQMYVRSSRGRYLCAKCLAAFASGFLVAAVPLMLNLVVLACALPGYTPEVVDGLYFGLSEGEALVSLFFGAPWAYVLVNTLIDGCLCGLWAVFVLGVSCLVDNRALLLVGAYLSLLMIKYANENVFGALGINGFRFNLIDMLRSWSLTYTKSMVVVCIVLVFLLATAAAILRAQRDSDVL